jgi:hypothetical protein
MTKKHAEHIYLGICLTIITLGSLLVLWWWFFPGVPLETDTPNTIQVDKTVYHAGDHIAYTLSYCKTKPMLMTVTRALVNDFRLTFTEVLTDPPVGCHTFTYNDLIIPDFMPNGTYHLEATLEAQINPIRKFNEIWRSVDFKIRGNIFNGISTSK